jgi:hydrogenase expression/formation protein HypE
VTDFACPAPLARYPHIVMGHGAGGALMRDLVEHVFVAAFGPRALEDASTLDVTLQPGERIAMTTDGFVVRPRFFPGGNIGSLAVCGTVNDLAVSGARAVALSAGFILEEGLAIAELVRIARSMGDTARACGVRVVCGDTKVVERGKGDGVFITTTGIGVVPTGRALSVHGARAGDVVIVSGPIGDHGVAILCAREQLGFSADVVSDCASLQPQCSAVIAACPSLRLLRDATRGGVNAVCHEIAAGSGVGIVLDDAAIPVRPAVHAACELLGLDVLGVACEGRLVAVVSADDAAACLRALGTEARAIGRVTREHAGTVQVTSALGGQRLLVLPAGEQLPRIC